MTHTLADALADTPIIAILRGLTPDEAASVGAAVVVAGVRALEVPLNSPEPFASIRHLADAVGDRAAVGAGTVLRAADVDASRDAGGGFVVAPNTDAAVIVRARALGLTPTPGVATATEAFTAIAAGATRLKLFPASTYGPGHMKALCAVLPAHVAVYAVGGVSVDELGAWRDAGAAGVGVGSEVFKPGMSASEVGARAAVFVARARETWRDGS